MAKSRFTVSIASAKRSLKPIAAGILLSIPFWQAEYGWLVVPCALGYVLWLDSKPPVKQIWLSGIAFFGIVISWMYHIHATELIPNNALAIVFLSLTITLVVGALSLGFLAFGWGYHRLKIDLRQPRALILVPALWALGEWGHSYLFSILSLGPGGSVGPYWNFGSLAFAASVTPLGYASRIVGQFGLSALVIVSALGILFVARKQRKWGSIALGVVVVFCTAGWIVSPAANGSKLRVGVLQLDDSSYSDYGYQRDLGQLMASHAPSAPLDLLVLPEYSYIFDRKEYKAAETSAFSQVTTDKSLIITSRSGEADQARSNLVTYFKPDGQIVTQQEKQFLIPAGEFIPYFYEWILVLSGNTSVISAHQEKNDIATGHQVAQPVAYGSDRVGSLACSGAIAPDFYRKLADGGATVLTNSAALSTMGLSSSYYAQARQMASFIAVSTARPFVQSARGAQVFTLDSNGKVVAESDKPGIHYIEADITTNTTKTPYSAIGDMAILLAAAVAIAYLAYKK